MPSYYKSGKYGYLSLNPVAGSGVVNLPIYDFSFNLSNNDLSWYDADSGGFPERTYGIPLNKFTFNAPVLDFGGDKFFGKYHSLSTYLFPYNDVYGTSGCGIDFYGRINSISGVWSWRDNTSLRYTLDLDILNYDIVASPKDFSQEDAIKIIGSCQRKVEERSNDAEENVFIKIDYLESATFTISAKYNQIVDAGSYLEYNSNLYPILDCVVALKYNTLLFNSPMDLIDVYNKYSLDQRTITNRNKNLFSYKFYINDTEYWEFNNMLPIRIYDIVVDRVSGAIVGCTIELAITGKGSSMFGSGSGADVNTIDTSIYAPNDTLVWPFAMVGL